MTTQEMTTEEKTSFVRENWEAYLDKELPADKQKVMQDIICNCDYTSDFIECQSEFSEKLKLAIKEGCTNCPDTLSDRISSALDACEQDLCDDCEPVEETAEKEQKPLPFPWFPAGLMAVAAAIVVAVAIFGGFASDGGSKAARPTLEQVLTPLVASADFSVPAVTKDKCQHPELAQACKKMFKDGPDMPLFIDGQRMVVPHYTQSSVDGHDVVCAIYDHPDGQRFALMLLSCDCLDDVMPKMVKSQEVVLEGKKVMFWRRGEYVQVLVADGDDQNLRKIATSIQAT
ncbi:MAG: hypothetical protein ACYTDT_07725 [Planctomycetota bacterium]|jgi:hypothetical protein